MDAAKATAAIHKILQRIQKDCPKLTGTTKPLKELEKFTSPVSFAATGMLKRELGLTLDPKINLFGDKNGAYTIEKTVALLCKAADDQEKKQAAKV